MFASLDVVLNTRLIKAAREILVTRFEFNLLYGFNSVVVLPMSCVMEQLEKTDVVRSI